MKNIIIQGTIVTPEIIFDFNNKTITLNGSSLPDYGGTFYDDVENKLYNFLQLIDNELTIIFNMVYMNTMSNKRILELFKICKKRIPDLKVIWRYQSDDLFMMEEGEIYEKLLNMEFVYQSYDD